MNRDVRISPDLSLTALRGAVGEVVGVGRAGDCWDQIVGLWRIFQQLDRLMALLWTMIHRIRAGEHGVAGVCPAAAAIGCARVVVAGSGLGRLRAVAGDRAMPGRPGLMGAVASAGEGRLVDLGSWDCGLPDRGWPDPGCQARCWGELPPMSGGGWRRFSESGWGGARSCVLIVPVG